MKPYLTPNPTLAFVIEWGVLIISILLVFSPFIYLGIKKWKKNLPVSWKQVVGAYVSSFAIYFIWEWVILVKIDMWLYNGFTNTGWLRNVLSGPSFKMIFITMFGWPLLAFYCTKLIRDKFTFLNLSLTGVFGLIFLILLFILYMFLSVSALVNIGNNYL
ncbi:MAG: hypothetical protein UT07_C0008G0029 [Parcubacteria group bacterium GW2011_GWB1_38_8]|uniref:Uncharacterized protein n=1 Tax=Candidatus Zambryskibacteria bacterium RIFCSPLOWO2_02_FULL_39_14 TaxID=1802769 RepID=A0A1G2UF20_9BACT|nr:MAG: hypothetical protein UT07_C0008G0029 [Parcubacteria group bacterium GW2011_GWB1_38_8]KKR31035.1 MAG: hypothetical protein UT62_C0001G0027 [Parcubacteria group bacterium GW2011_GWC1_39_8]OHA95638.1 MAG: hypothetical protein A3C62_01615 [Candidatus Zambryskibacteria bacterium RIFCSPHIGHO2_02_FULL_39_16]OHB08026.1 MAG: hypothetical protein A3I86_01450 [Candidatus Zambryskibacteria bacterium RIFCSPLOWO2_02_FULL_39_14]